MQSFCNRQASTPIILTMAIASLAWYLALLLNPENIGHPVAYGLLLFAETIGMVQLLGLWTTIVVGKPEGVRYDIIAAKEALAKNPTIAGTVAVFVPVAGEAIEIITETLRAARDIRFPHQTWVLDDGKSDDVKALAASLGVGYLRRSDRKGWKAGNLNNAIQKVPCDFFAIFDSDHVAKPEFLDETLPWLMVDPNVAFVQTPQHLVNRDSFVGGGIAECNEVFYRHIQTGKNHFNAAFCVGTNVVFRAEAVREMGGIYDQSHSEDIWTSLLLHERGWKSVYLPMILAEGLAPDTIDSYFRQQFRWASGGYELLFRHNPLLSKTLSFDQRLQYFHTALFFTSGFSVLTFFVLPLLYVYFGWKPIAVLDGAPTWLAHFVPYFILMYGTVAHLLGRWPRWRTYVVAMGAFPSHIFAFLAVVTGLKLQWSATGAIRSNIDYIKAVMPHILLLLLTVAAIPVLVTTERNAPLSFMMTFWLFWNAALLFAICRRALPGLSGARSPKSAYGYAAIPTASA